MSKEKYRSTLHTSYNPASNAQRCCTALLKTHPSTDRVYWYQVHGSQPGVASGVFAQIDVLVGERTSLINALFDVFDWRRNRDHRPVIVVVTKNVQNSGRALDNGGGRFAGDIQCCPCDGFNQSFVTSFRNVQEACCQPQRRKRQLHFKTKRKYVCLSGKPRSVTEGDSYCVTDRVCAATSLAMGLGTSCLFFCGQRWTTEQPKWRSVCETWLLSSLQSGCWLTCLFYVFDSPSAKFLLNQRTAGSWSTLPFAVLWLIWNTASGNDLTSAAWSTEEPLTWFWTSSCSRHKRRSKSFETTIS